MITQAYWSVYSIIWILPLLKRCNADKDLTSVPVTVEVYKFDNCPSEDPLPMSFENITMRMDIQTKKLYVSGNLNMTVPWTVNIKTQLKVLKCLARDDDNSCNKYFETNVHDICGHMDDKGQQWSPFVEAVKKFDPHCPVKADNYDVVDAPIATAMLENMQAAFGIWRLDFTAWDNDVVVLCTTSAVEVKRPRRGKKKSAIF